MATASELTINTTATATDLANELFGAGVTLVSATFTGDAVSSGVYTGATTTLGGISPTDSGVILSTGNVTDFTQTSGDPNISAGTTTDTTGVDGDPGLDAIAGVATFDGAIFEATFIPQGDYITIQFVFSSEEYLEYVGGGVTDSIGVWVNGVQATLAVGGGNVTIDTLNDTSNSNVYVDNPDTADLYNTEMDGFTVPITLKAPVTSGAENTIKIGIADGGDASYDSNLLIMGGSVQTVMIAQDDEINILQNSTGTFDILGNDINDSGNSMTITQINGQDISVGQTITVPTGEQITLNADQTITVVSDGDIGSEPFTYTVTDSAGVSDVGFMTINTVAALPLDYVVEGTAGDNLIDSTYTGDPEGDRIDNSDAVDASQDDLVLAGGGNDTVNGGAGNDTIYGDSAQSTSTSGTITAANFSDTSSGFTVTAQNIVGGTQTAASSANVSTYDNGGTLGFGANGAISDSDSAVSQQTGYDLASGLSETLIVDFDSPVTQADFSFDALYTDAYGEQAQWEIYNDGVLVASGTFTEDVVGSGQGTVDISGYGEFDQLVLTGLIQTDLTDGSDFLITEINYSGEPIVNDGTGDDSIFAGIGDDVVYGEAGSDTIFGEAGNDTLLGGDGNDNIDGDDGNDSLVGGAGDDTIIADAGADTASGGDGADAIYASGGANQLSGDAGNDSIFGGADGDTISGGDDADLLHGNDGNDSLLGDAGNDSVYGGVGLDTILGGTGDDYLAGGDDNDYIDGGADNDNLDGDAGDDTLIGNLGNDNIDGGIGNDSILGGDGSDSIWGGAGNDIIDGGTGVDAIYGGTGNDSIIGGAGGDYIELGGGNDTVDAGDDADNIVVTALGQADGNVLTIDGGTGGVDSDTLNLASFAGYRSLSQTTDLDGDSTSGSVEVKDGSGNWITVNFTEIENLILPATDLSPDYIVEGTTAGELIDASYTGDPEGDMVDALDNAIGTNDDSILAEAGNDTVYSGLGNDIVAGGAGDDLIYGEAGNDTLNGGDNNDTIIGGTGNDSIEGDTGNDSLSGGLDDDFVAGGLGDDWVTGDTGNDTVYGGEGNDSVFGAAGDDLMFGDAGDDSMEGWIGNDTMSGGAGNDYVDGGDGADSLLGGDGSDTLLGGNDANADTLDGGAGDDSLSAGDGDDILEGGTGADFQFGGGGDDTFVLEDNFGNDTIQGWESSEINGDSIDGSALTQDVIVDLSAGNAGDPESGTISAGLDEAQFLEIENITLGSGDDSVIGSTGNDSVSTGTGADTVDGGAGNDTFDIGADTDRDVVVLADGDGDDTIANFDLTDSGDGTTVDQLDVSGLTSDGGTTPVTTADVVVTDTNGDGTGDAILTFPGGESITLVGVLASQVDDPAELVALGIPSDGIVEGTAAGDLITGTYTGDPDGDMVDANDAADGSNDDVIYGYGGNDIIDAGAGNNTVYGGDGNDQIFGGSNADLIDGGTENDSLYSGLGDDTVLGGDGDDSIFASGGADSIDAGAGDDTIRFTDADTVLGGDGDDSFRADALVLDGSPISITGGEGGETSGDTISSGTYNSDVIVDLTAGGTGTDPESGTMQLGTTTVTFSEIEHIQTGAGDDTVIGSTGGESLFMGAGADSVSAGGGNDTVFGDLGNDLIDGGDGNDLVFAGSDQDTVTGGLGNDSLYGGAGDDLLQGGDGTDLLSGDAGTDTLEGGAGNDVLDMGAPDGNADTVVLSDGDGDDTVSNFEAPIDNGDGTFTGQDQLDVSNLTDANGAQVNTSDVVVSDTNGDGTGDAILTFPNGESITLVGVLATDVDDPVALEAMGIPKPNYVVEGTAGADLIDASYTGDPEGDMVDDNDDPTRVDDNVDLIKAGDGNDTVYAGASADTVEGEAGDDLIYGEAGNDTLYGQAGADTIDGGAGADMVFAGADNDSVTGGDGADIINDGAGDDYIDGGADQDIFISQNGYGNDTVVGGETGVDYDTLRSYITTDSVLDLTAGGTAGDNESGTLTSGGGADVINFTEIENIELGSGNDSVIGSDLAETVSGGAGADTFNGGGGDDLFLMGAADGDVDTVVLADGDGNDTLGQFEAPTGNGDGTFTGNDQLDVSGLTDASGNPVSTEDVTVTDTNGDGTGNAILTFPDGTSVTMIGVPVSAVSSPAQLEALGIPAAPGDFIVEGTASGDLIDGSYAGDPEGDMIDNNDAANGSNDDVVQAGDGNDTVLAGDGNDWVYAGTGDDSIEGGIGNDTIYAEEGDDTVLGGDGNDSIFGFEGSDSVDGGAGDDFINTRTSPGTGVPDQGYPGFFTGDAATTNDMDTVDGGTGNDTILSGDDDDLVSGGDGADSIDAGFDDDTVTGGAGADTILANEGSDYVDGGLDDDLIYGDGTDTLTGPLNIGDETDLLPANGMDTLLGGDGNDTIFGMDDADQLFGGTGNDSLDGGLDNDTIWGGVGDDYMLGDHGDDVFMLEDNFGNDTIYGGETGATNIDTIDLTNATVPVTITFTGDKSGTLTDGTSTIDFFEIERLVLPDGNDLVTLTNDSAGIEVIAGGGNDTLVGGTGADTLDGGTGNDVFSALGDGDVVTGGDGDDVFNVSRDDLSGGTLTIDGSEGGESAGDTLNITGPATIVYDGGNPENGTVTWLDGTTLTFSNIENVSYVPCFTADTQIKTLRGEIRAADLKPGDLVLTRDTGYKPLRWVGSRKLSKAELHANPALNPVRIKAGALGRNQPETDLIVSPQHRMLVGSAVTQLWFGEDEVLVAAIHLTCLEGVEQINAEGVTYVHIMCDDHQIVCGDGAWSESFQPGDMTLAGMDQGQRDEIFTLFPELRDESGEIDYPAARVTLKAHEARVLALS